MQSCGFALQGSMCTQRRGRPEHLSPVLCLHWDAWVLLEEGYTITKYWGKEALWVLGAKRRDLVAQGASNRGTQLPCAFHSFPAIPLFMKRAVPADLWTGTREHESADNNFCWVFLLGHKPGRAESVHSLVDLQHRRATYQSQPEKPKISPSFGWLLCVFPVFSRTDEMDCSLPLLKMKTNQNRKRPEIIYI